MSTLSTADCEMEEARSKGLSTFAERSSAAHTTALSKIGLFRESEPSHDIIVFAGSAQTKFNSLIAPML